MSMYDTIIIGAGMSGLAAGIRLAYYDQRVCILERHTTIGGLNSFYRLGGRNYDVGLHAVTNFTPKGTRKGPLARLLRQLRFSWDDFSLAPQIGSTIAFPGVTLRFNNDFELLALGGRSATFRPRTTTSSGWPTRSSTTTTWTSTRPAARPARSSAEIISDPLLVEMLFCPLMFYGSARRKRHGLRASSRSCSAAFSWRAWPGPGPACG